MFDQGLGIEKMVQITKCQIKVKGNIISWEDKVWSLESPLNTTEVEVVDLELDVCPRRVASLLLVPQRMAHGQGTRICNKLSGRLAGYSMEAEFDEVTRFLAKRSSSYATECSTPTEEGQQQVQVYLGVTDAEVEGSWRKEDGSAVEHLPWARNRPYNDGDLYNCLMVQVDLADRGRPVLDISAASINDEACRVPWCPLCRINAPQNRVELRGLCKESIFNRVYVFTLTEEGRLRYVGDVTSSISFSVEEGVWVLADRQDMESRAVSRSLESSLLLGRHTLDFSGVRGDTCTSGTREVVVKLTTCGEGRFTCSDGQCVSMDDRCNQVANCMDKSDEENCRVLIMEENYNKKIAPFGFDSGIIPVEVHVSMAVMDIISIKEVDLNYILKFRLVLEWYDHRLIYHNLKEDRSGNLLTREDIRRLWIPFVVFSNTERNEATTGDDNTELTISRQDTSQPDNTKHYQASGQKCLNILTV